MAAQANLLCWVQLFTATQRTVAHQAPLCPWNFQTESQGVDLFIPTPGDLLKPESEPILFCIGRVDSSPCHLEAYAMT